jgi:hypothetical protein
MTTGQDKSHAKTQIRKEKQITLNFIEGAAFVTAHAQSKY